jgi:hypothetical protein
VWAHFDDGLHGDPRILDAGLAAAGLYLCVTTYMARYLTDGVISERAVAGMLEHGDTQPLDALLRVGLLVCRDDGDYEAPEYLIGNRTKAKTEEIRENEAQRIKDWRAKNKKQTQQAAGDVTV